MSINGSVVLPFPLPSGSFAARQGRAYQDALATLVNRHPVLPKFNKTNTKLLQHGFPIGNLVGAHRGRERIWLNRTSARQLACIPSGLRGWVSPDMHSENDQQGGALAFWYAENGILLPGWCEALVEVLACLGRPLGSGPAPALELRGAWRRAENRSGPVPGSAPNAGEAWMVPHLSAAFAAQGKRSTTAHSLDLGPAGRRVPDLWIEEDDHGLEAEPSVARARGCTAYKTSGLSQVSQWPCRLRSIAVPAEGASGSPWADLESRCDQIGVGLFTVQRDGVVTQVLAPRDVSTNKSGRGGTP